MNDITNLRLCGWDGTHIGKALCGERYKWGMHRCITTLYSTSIVRVHDPVGLAAIVDEFSCVMKLYKIGTFRYKNKAYEYTSYSFMTGETPYQTSSDYVLDELCDRWMIYYSWWNISLKNEDMYVRKVYGKETVVPYPNASWQPETVLGDYGIHIPEQLSISNNRASMKSLLSSWLSIYSEGDLNTIINMYRNALENIIMRIAPDHISTITTIISRIRNFLIFYLVTED